MYGKPLPKMAFQKGMYDRTISVYSAGKIFAATGIRSGWVIGPTELVGAAEPFINTTFFVNITWSEMQLPAVSKISLSLKAPT